MQFCIEYEFEATITESCDLLFHLLFFIDLVAGLMILWDTPTWDVRNFRQHFQTVIREWRALDYTSTHLLYTIALMGKRQRTYDKY